MDKYIILTRPAGMNGFLEQKLKGAGKLTYQLPTIKISANKLSLNEIQSIKNITSFDWIIFTSVNGVKSFMKLLIRLSIPSTKIKNIQIGVIGPATAKAAIKHGLTIAFQPSIYISSQIPKEIGDINGKKILLPRADIASKELEYALEEKGAVVKNIPIYTTSYDLGVDPEFMKLIQENKVSCITFTSASTVKGFMKRIDTQTYIFSLPAVCIGPVTARTAINLGFHNTKIAKEYTIEGIWNILKILYNE